jgi:glycosyltransferase involved in cell wall biosynthesis
VLCVTTKNERERAYWAANVEPILGDDVEVRGESGFIVSSVEEMSAAVDRVGELDPHRMRARVEQRFSAEPMVAGYERIYQEVLAADP